MTCQRGRSSGPTTGTSRSANIDGGAPDYRMPPVWEYGNANPGLYRAFDNLSRDLGLVTRYVAINLLFTTSPLYKPMISPPSVPGALNVDFNVYQANPALDGLTMLDTAYFKTKLNALQPSNQFTTDMTSQPFASRAAAVYRLLLRRCLVLRQEALRDRVRRFVPVSQRSPDAVHRGRRRLRSAGVSVQRHGHAERRRPARALPTTTGATARRATCSGSWRHFSRWRDMASRRRASRGRAPPRNVASA